MKSVVRKDSLQGQINAEIAKERVYLPPEDMEALVGAELNIWNQYISSRFEWKPQDLRTVHSLVKLDAYYRKISEEAREIPLTYEKASGDHAAHPIHTEVRQVHKALQAEIRALCLYPDSREKDKYSGAAAAAPTRGKKKMGLVG